MSFCYIDSHEQEVVWHGRHSRLRRRISVERDRRLIAIGRAIGEKLGGKVLIGQDTRMSSPWIFEHLQKGLLAHPATLQNAGVIPTPAVALLTKWRGYSGGVMISASHNPYQDNGIKVFAADGTKLKDAEEMQIEKRIFELLGSQHGERQIDTIPDAKYYGSKSTRAGTSDIRRFCSRIFRNRIGCEACASSSIAPTAQ